MGRRKSDENPVSLFAFQDIITSITGIMILVVLLLILDILEGKPVEKKSAPKPKSPFSENINELIKTEQELQSLIKKDKKWLEKNRKMMEQIMSTNLTALPKLIEKETRKSLALETMIKKLQENNKFLRDRIKTVKADDDNVKKEIAQVVILIDEKKGEKKKLEVDILDLEAKVKKLGEQKAQAKNQVEFLIDKNLNKNPVFVECDAGNIKVKLIKPKKEILPPFKGDKDNFMPMLNQFYTWFKRNCNPAKEYIVMMVKPESSKYVNILIAMLKKEGFNYALEPMEQDKTGIF